MYTVHHFISVVYERESATLKQIWNEIAEDISRQMILSLWQFRLAAALHLDLKLLNITMQWIQDRLSGPKGRVALRALDFDQVIFVPQDTVQADPKDERRYPVPQSLPQVPGTFAFRCPETRDVYAVTGKGVGFKSMSWRWALLTALVFCRRTVFIPRPSYSELVDEMAANGAHDDLVQMVRRNLEEDYDSRQSLEEIVNSPFWSRSEVSSPNEVCSVILCALHYSLRFLLWICYFCFW